jgi:beta-lactam-binding protein with PASTA domain
MNLSWTLSLCILLILFSNLLVTFAMDSSAAENRDWQHLVGKTGEEAREEIQKEFPKLNVHIVPHVSSLHIFLIFTVVISFPINRIQW